MIRVPVHASAHGSCRTDLPIKSLSTKLIYNPAAGRLRGRGRARLDRAASILERAGYAISMAPTTGPGTAGDIARDAIAAGAEFIVAAGGDGTINEVLDGVASAAVPLGILPAGTANVLATEIGLGSNMEHAAKLMPESVAKRIAIGRLDCGQSVRHFLSMAGVGFDAHIVYNLSAGLKRRLGKAAYWVGGFSQVIRQYPEFQVEIDGAARELCSFALFSRVRNYGGDFQIAQHIGLLDNHFEVVLFRGRTPFPYLKYVFGLTTGSLAGMRGVSFSNAQCVRISDPQDRRIYVQVDGESAGHLPTRVSLVPDAVTLLVPPSYISRI
jgi:YegS/Rv2252/BmrU family lipid kinase